MADLPEIDDAVAAADLIAGAVLNDPAQAASVRLLGLLIVPYALLGIHAALLKALGRPAWGGFFEAGAWPSLTLLLAGDTRASTETLAGWLGGSFVGCCGPAGSDERPLLLIDAAYTNYMAFAERLGRRTVSITRTLGADGRFSLPALDAIEEVIRTHRPGAMVVIPYDNPTGQFYERETLVALARLCVEHDLWLVSDEAYRELGRSYERVGDFDEAEAAYRAPTALNAGDCSTWNSLGTFLMIQGRYEDALGCFERSAELAPPEGAARETTAGMELHRRYALAGLPCIAET